jgi:CRISPR associated protein Cas1
LVSKPSSRRATNPANAILNYLYAILEAEARIAALRMGLDPGLGFLHADQTARDSLACDLMEPVRLERAEKIERFVRTVKAQLANTEAAAQLDRFLEWSEDYAATLRKRCFPDDLDAAIAVAGLFKPENNRSGN